MGAKERFLKYVSFGTNSDEESDSCPSTPSQLELGGYLADELRAIGLRSVRLDGDGYVYGFLPGAGKLAGATAVGFISHMDTSPSSPGDGIRPSEVTYEGGDILLADGRTSITAEDFPELAGLVGERLIVTDGRTLLGSDDKAGIAEIVTACELLTRVTDRRPVAVAFTPDEEIGRGADRFDVRGFGADEAYTVDGGAIGEIEYENFNAASFSLSVTGTNIHPGYAKGLMKNAVLMANEFLSMLPPAERPEHTEGREGFYHITSISGDESSCTVKGIIRDHDRAGFEARKKTVEGVCRYLDGKYGAGRFDLTLTDSYFNMKEMILPRMHLIRDAEAAFEKEGVTPVIKPVRGGTDGARLSFMGLPCPNLSAGGLGFHSRREFIPVSSLGRMTNVIVNIATAAPSGD